MTKSTTFAKGETPINSKKTSVEATGKKLAPDLAKGGKGKDQHMLAEKTAGTKKGGTSGQTNIEGPNKQFAEGGDHPTPFAGAHPALPGRSGVSTVQRQNYSKGG
jgi:hypothetical protein